MAERPVFVPSPDAPGFVKVVNFSIPWAGGFALVQKQKNLMALRAAASRIGLNHLLEISSKSDEKVGRHLSAFHLKIASRLGELSLESAFQGSKVFEGGGPFRDIYELEPREAKRDVRIKNSGRLVGFDFFGVKFSLYPATSFYDWLYIKSIFQHKDWILNRIDGDHVYDGYTDIEFNPIKSINCQAKSCALFVGIYRAGLLTEEILDPSFFVNMMIGEGKGSGAYLGHEGRLAV